MRFVCFVCAASFLYAGLNLPAIAQVSSSPPNNNAIDAVSSDELKLADGTLVHLENIEQPFPGRKWRDTARSYLKQITTGKVIPVENQSTDRYGRLTGQIYVIGENKQKIWLQGEMLRQGLAFVYAAAENNDEQAGDLRVIEGVARKAQAGIWGRFGLRRYKLQMI